MMSSLTIRIFGIFWLILVLVFILTIILSQLDSCQLTSLLKNEQRQGSMIVHHVEKELNQDPPNDPLWWRRLFHAINQKESLGQHLLLVTRKGHIIGAKHNEMKIIRDFISQSDNVNHPKKKKYGYIELVGPFSVHDGKDSYQLYLMRLASSWRVGAIHLPCVNSLLLIIIIILVSSPLLLWLSWSLIKSVYILKKAADEVASGHFQQYPDLETGPKEFIAAGFSFNKMVRVLEKMLTTQQHLLSDISHELRTPLTRLQLTTALMRRRYGEGRELDRIELEAQRIDRMINDLLMLSHEQYKKNESVNEAIKTDILFQRILEDAKFEAEQMGKNLEVLYPPGPWLLYGNPCMLESALENIIRNALRYSHSYILVSFSVEKQGIKVHVDDDGPGVMPEYRKKIFRPFYRTDEARNLELAGTGLGLAIARTIIQQHHGWIKADDSPLNGLRMTVWLPLYSLH